ncbi:LysE/ArgO family amino acid transporter [Paenibacillus montanisoli]|uniref:Amino acid transporter n=1 Tax=Paenibacillus montanisoli TaxID=2081970 RepID=A0A328TY38_9BACL|nr:LysE/ArgO family amino acid transporter [Paenibacillus montanisoli]RAP73605.1 amino acid transporter [Paenibacillus montanisoli]
MIGAIIHGFILALGLILPLGVQNVFVFNQGATQPKFRKALPVIITASVCDTILILLAVLGVSVLVLQFDWLKTALFAAGIVFLLYMGWMTWRSKTASRTDSASEALGAKKQIAFAASVSLLNPHAILDTVGVIGTGSLQYGGAEKAAFAAACIAISWLWFTSLAAAGRLAGNLDKSGRLMVVLNKMSAVVMWGTGVYLAAGLLGE